MRWGKELDNDGYCNINNGKQDRLPNSLNIFAIIPVVGIRPERWYVAGRHSIAGPVKELQAIATDPKMPIRFILSLTECERLRAEARNESKEYCVVPLCLALMLSPTSSPLLVSTRSRVVSFIAATIGMI